MKKSIPMNLVVFASGSGSNAVKIIEHFKNHDKINVTNIFCNKESAGIIDEAKSLGVDVTLFNRDEFKSGVVLEKLKLLDTGFIALAGFLWLVPSQIVNEFPNKILNIHPALLPKYGGKGMHGINIHKAVVENREKESGITIHLVNEKYDDGGVIFQEKVNVSRDDTPESLASKVLKIEHKNYAKVIEKHILG